MQALDPRFFSFNSKHGACPACDGLGMLENLDGDRHAVCPECQGSRLRPEALAVRIGGYSIWDLVQQPCSRVHTIFKGVSFHAREMPIAKPILA
jgi:excinuclease ABC subunit A